jgi:hypothetical protein
MDFSKIASLAKRSLPVSREFDDIIRAIGECKSKGEEDLIVARVVEISKQKLKEPRRDVRALKELLVYLMYVEMLGHETSWAQAAVIQLCSEKNLALKKVGVGTERAGRSGTAPGTSEHLPTGRRPQMAYLATSLLVEPSSELTIMVTATIQADLRSDNFLVGERRAGAAPACRCRASRRGAAGRPAPPPPPRSRSVHGAAGDLPHGQSGAGQRLPAPGHRAAQARQGPGQEEGAAGVAALPAARRLGRARRRAPADRKDRAQGAEQLPGRGRVGDRGWADGTPASPRAERRGGGCRSRR